MLDTMFKLHVTTAIKANFPDVNIGLAMMKGVDIRNVGQISYKHIPPADAFK